MTESKEIRLSLQLTATSETPGSYEILAITSGLGNGWKFSPSVLQKSLSLWSGVHCFIDHSLAQRSVKDIAGILENPTFDDASQGVRATLKPFGPSADLLTSLAPNLISSESTDYKIGFSADLSFLGTKNQVDEIVRVHSVDLVVNPARGGKFLKAVATSSCTANAENIGFRRSPNENVGFRQATILESEAIGFRQTLNSEKKGELMPEEENTITEPVEEQDPTCPPTKSGVHPEPAPNAHASQTPINQQLQQELDQAKEMRRQLSAYTLDQALATANLPKPSIDHLRKQFHGKDFTLPDLQSAIDEQRQLLSDLTASNAIKSHANPEQMFNESDRLQAAVDDLFGLPRQAQLANLKAPKLHGIRELYLTLTGDVDLHGGYYPERVQLATTADFSGLVKNALNKIVTNTWDELGRAGYDWWKYVTAQEHFNTLHDVTGTLVGTVGDLPSVAEGGTYTELPIGDSPEVASFTKYGGYIPLTLELIDRDETRKLRSYARELASAGMRKISKLVAAIFTANSGTGPYMADSETLFNTIAATMPGGHANLGTSALSATNWDLASKAVYQQPMLIKNEAGKYGIGPQMAINPKFLMVPRALQKTAMEICEGNFVRESGYVYDNILKGTAVPIVVPDWTDASDWAAACDPLIAPAIYVGDRFGLMPEIFVAGSELSPAVFTNDEHRIKVRHFLAVWVNDFRPLFKCNVA